MGIELRKSTFSLLLSRKELPFFVEGLGCSCLRYFMKLSPSSFSSKKADGSSLIAILLKPNR